MNDVSDFARFVGFFTAHAVWQTEGGEVVIPLLAFESGNGERRVERVQRVQAEKYEDAARHADEKFGEGKASARFALVAIDGYMHGPGQQKMDAIVVDGSAQGAKLSVKFAVPYRPAGPGDLVVYPPVIYEVEGTDRASFNNAFWAGVEEHKEASAFWKQHLAESPEASS